MVYAPFALLCICIKLRVIINYKWAIFSSRRVFLAGAANTCLFTVKVGWCAIAKCHCCLFWWYLWSEGWYQACYQHSKHLCTVTDLTFGAEVKEHSCTINVIHAMFVYDRAAFKTVADSYCYFWSSSKIAMIILSAHVWYGSMILFLSRARDAINIPCQIRKFFPPRRSDWSFGCKCGLTSHKSAQLQFLLRQYSYKANVARLRGIKRLLRALRFKTL